MGGGYAASRQQSLRGGKIPTVATSSKAVKEVAAPQEDRVAVHIPRGEANGEGYYFVSVNDYQATLPRGKTSYVPAYVAREIERAFAEGDRLAELQESMEAKNI